MKCVYFRARKTSVKSGINLVFHRHSRSAAKKQKELSRCAVNYFISAIRLSPNESRDHDTLMRCTTYRIDPTHWVNQPQNPSKKLTFFRIAANNDRNAQANQFNETPPENPAK